MLSIEDFNLSNAYRDRLKANLNNFQAIENEDQSLRKAAVAVVVAGTTATPSTPAILLTLRPYRLNQHSGQYALPGGKVDNQENSVQAALRELEEELGLILGKEHVLGQLDDYPTRSGFRITPVVLWAGCGHELTPSPDEVAEVFHIPFHELDSDAIPVFEQGVEEYRPVLLSEFPSLGHRMYSPTASILYQFREVAIRGLDTRVAHFDQPRFAWQ